MIETIRRKTGARILVETGTFRGLTACRCSATFERVYTIELDAGLATAATEFLAKKRNVRVIQGDAIQELSRLFLQHDIRDTLVFLDAHVCGPGTACGAIPEPAIEELRILSEHKDKVQAIIIDDFRNFGREHGFPTKSALLRAAEERFAEAFEIGVYLDQVIIVRSISYAEDDELICSDR
jgi:hypothetical protein